MFRNLAAALLAVSFVASPALAANKPADPAGSAASVRTDVPAKHMQHRHRTVQHTGCVHSRYHKVCHTKAHQVRHLKKTHVATSAGVKYVSHVRHARKHVAVNHRQSGAAQGSTARSTTN